MNIAQIYAETTGKIEPKEVVKDVSPAEDAGRAQAKYNWLQATITKEMISSIKMEIEDLKNKAIELATTYPTHKNHEQIVQLLVKADTLRKVLDTYARSN